MKKLLNWLSKKWLNGLKKWLNSANIDYILETMTKISGPCTPGQWNFYIGEGKERKPNIYSGMDFCMSSMVQIKHSWWEKVFLWKQLICGPHLKTNIDLCLFTGQAKQALCKTHHEINRDRNEGLSGEGGRRTEYRRKSLLSNGAHNKIFWRTSVWKTGVLFGVLPKIRPRSK